MNQNRTILEAIARRKHIAATYNRVRMKLAPHILYTRGEELYIDAIAVEKGGKTPRDRKVGTFKLAGLGGLALLDEGFMPEPVFNPFSAKYTDTTLLMVQR